MIKPMKNLFLLLLNLALLTSCTSSNGEKGDLKGKVMCTITQFNAHGGTNMITEYQNDKHITKQLLYLPGLSTPEYDEFLYVYQGKNLVSVLNVNNNGSKMFNPDEFKKELEIIDIVCGDYYFNLLSKEKINYKYDNKGNWIERSIEGEKNRFVQSRKIYYMGEDYRNVISEYESFKNSVMSSKSDENNNSNYQENIGYQQNTNNNNNQKEQNLTECSYCRGTGKCPSCNKVFRVHYWDGYGYKDENETRPGKVMCETCYGSGKIYGTMDLIKKAPNYRTCYVCNGSGWRNCPECNYGGDGQHLGECSHCNGTGYKK